MKRTLALRLSALAAAALAQCVWAQGSNQWRVFTHADGLPQAACIAVTVGAAGNILTRHADSNMVSVLDGYGVTLLSGPESSRVQLFESPAGQLWALTGSGIQEFREGNWLRRVWPEAGETVDGIPVNALALCPVRQGRVLVLFADRLVELVSGGSEQASVRVIRRAEQTALGRFISWNSGPDGALWICGAAGAAKIAGPLRNLKLDAPWLELIPPAELQITNIQSVAEDSSGVLVLRAESVTTAVPMAAQYEATRWSVVGAEIGPVRFAWRSSGRTWLVVSNTVWDGAGRDAKFQRHDEITGTEINGVASEPSGAFWLATDRGLFRHVPMLWQPQPTPVESAASQSEARPDVPEEIARHTQWKAFLVARRGDLWLGEAQDVAWRHRNEWRIFSSTNQIGPEDVTAFAESPEGRVYSATTGKVWEFDGRNWMTLRGGFESIHGLHCGRDGTLWVATDAGLFRYERGSWIANGIEEGLPATAVLRVSEDDDGHIAVETAEGWYRLHPEADLEAPQTKVQTAATGEPTFREDTTVRLTFSGRDKWKQTVPGRLLFSYRFDEREWSPFREASEVALSDLSLGKHYFQVRAMDRSGNVESQPERLEFAMVLPWYRETRLVVVLTAALAVALFFAGVAINRHRKLRRSYAEVERAIEERTRELEQANRELVHGQKMNALGTLAAGIAHDFNNILSIVKGSAQIIEENLAHPEKVRTRLDRIKTVVQQGAGIVEAMLGFSRASDESASPCEINAVVEDTLTLLGDRFLREVEVRFDRGENLPSVSVARDFVQQVLLNFIFNAVEASSGRKHVVLKTQLVSSVPAGVVLTPQEAGPYIRIAVQDFGSGIASDTLPRIFEPFFTTKALSARRGTGLGLSMAYELAKKLGAGVAVETQVDVGSVFSLLLPVKPVAVTTLSTV